MSLALSTCRTPWQFARDPAQTTADWRSPVHLGFQRSRGPIACEATQCVLLMRDCFGDGRLVAIDGGGFGIEAVGLHKPARLLPSTSNTPVPDLTPYLGQVISYAGLLEAIGGKQTQELARLHVAELHIPSEEAGAVPVSPMWCVASGNLGSAPELRGDTRWSSSLAYAGSGENGSWLRLAVYAYYSIADLFSQLEVGDPIVACGALESYTYNDKERLQLALRRFQKNPRSGGAPKPPTVLMSSASAADVAADPFVDG